MQVECKEQIFGDFLLIMTIIEELRLCNYHLL